MAVTYEETGEAPITEAVSAQDLRRVYTEAKKLGCEWSKFTIEFPSAVDADEFAAGLGRMAGIQIEVWREMVDFTALKGASARTPPFIFDRALKVSGDAKLGMLALHYTNPGDELSFKFKQLYFEEHDPGLITVTPK